jgi:Protein of unknown function (DUF3025)
VPVVRPASGDGNEAAPGDGWRAPAPGGLVHPGFAPYARWWVPRRDAVLPAPVELDGWARAANLTLPGGPPVTFRTAPSATIPALAYERRIAATGEVAVRPGSLHDTCNALAWLAFPRTKAALNAIHAAATVTDTGNGRDRRRDAATLLDESGMIVACADAGLLELWRAHQWRAAFWDRRVAVADRMRAVVIGHGLLAKLVAPYRCITAKVLVLTLDGAALPADPARVAAVLDNAAAAAIGAGRLVFAPEELLALPVAALPGWDMEAKGARLFDDTAVFRPRMLR